MGGMLDILGVDRDKRHRDLYVGWLGADHEVETVTDGAAALEHVDEETDIVLLGRELDGPGGRQVAEEIDNRTGHCHVVMVSEEPADFDIVEYPIDSYVRKPLQGGDLDAMIRQYETQRSYRSALEEFFRLTSKLGAIEAELTEAERRNSDRYTRLRDRVEEKRSEVDEAISTAETDWNFAFKSCTRASDTQVVPSI